MAMLTTRTTQGASRGRIVRELIVDDLAYRAADTQRLLVDFGTPRASESSLQRSHVREYLQVIAQANGFDG